MLRFAVNAEPSGSPSAPPRAVRLGHIDNLRAIAALLVAWTHLAENFVPYAAPSGVGLSFLQWMPKRFNLGHAGVVLFFGISGFVIYGSLARQRDHAGRRFALSRFFRLYPAYWLSVLAGLIVLWWLPGSPTPWPMLAANAAMLPSLLGQDSVLGLYWTLETELVFYGLCWLLYRSGRMTHPWTLPTLIVALVVAWVWTPNAMALTHAHGWDMPSTLFLMPRHLALMFWGAACREAHEQTEGFRRNVRGSYKVWLAAALAVLFLRYFALDFWHYLMRGGHSRSTGRLIWPPATIAYVLALPLFCFWVAGPRINWRPLRWLGTISFSLYLFHPIVSALLEGRAGGGGAWAQWPLWTYLTLGLAGTVAVSAVVYYAVERPAIRLGARLAEIGANPAAHEPAETPFKTVAP